MKVTIEDMPELHVVTVHHVGPNPRISDAFQRLGAIGGAAGLFQQPGAMMLAIYYDDPETTPADRLQSDAGVTIPDGVRPPEGLVEKGLLPGRYARTTLVGPYSRLPEVWSRFKREWLPRSGHRVRKAPSYEVYRNDPTTAAPDELRTDLYLPIA